MVHRGRSVPVAALAAADAAALVAFVLAGRVSHQAGFAIAGLAKTAAPFLAAWFGVAVAAGAYRRPGWRTLALTWLVAVPLGAVVRSVVRGGPWDTRLLVFVGVGLAMTAVFLIAGRLLAASATRLAARRGSG